MKIEFGLSILLFAGIVLSMDGCYKSEPQKSSAADLFSSTDSNIPKPSGVLFSYNFKGVDESQAFHPDSVFSAAYDSGAKLMQGWYQPYATGCGTHEGGVDGGTLEIIHPSLYISVPSEGAIKLDTNLFTKAVGFNFSDCPSVKVQYFDFDKK